MAVIRVNKTSDYTVMCNLHLREKEMSLKAKGLLSLMLSLPDDWDYSIAGLCSICKEETRAIESALAELKKFGYLFVTKRMPNETESGRIEYTYDIYERPQTKSELKQGVQKQPLEIQGVEIQGVEKSGQLNTNILSTNVQSTDNISYDMSCKNEKLKISDSEPVNQMIIEIVKYLNMKTGKRFDPSTKNTRKSINARIKEGRTFEDFKKVIDVKVAKWKDDAKMCDYLRPDTLFGTKFESYLNESFPSPLAPASGREDTDNPFLKRLYELKGGT